MRALVVHELAIPSNILLEKDFVEPRVGPGEVVVDVFSAGLNFLDVWY